MTMLFRIEDVSSATPNSRNYDSAHFCSVSVEKRKVDRFIAEKIREQVNGKAGSDLLSYSKSLGVCLLKYNQSAGNELHILRSRLDYIRYYTHKGKRRLRDYQIKERLEGGSIFRKQCGQIKLMEFCIDISDNDLLSEYLQEYTGVGLKSRASPQKDVEAAVLNPPNDMVLAQLMEVVYVLYGLQLRCGFLRAEEARRRLAASIKKCFPDCRRKDEADEEIWRELRALGFVIEWLGWNAYWDSKQTLRCLQDLDSSFLPPDEILRLYELLSKDKQSCLEFFSQYFRNVLSHEILRIAAEYGNWKRHDPTRDEWKQTQKMLAENARSCEQ